VYAYLSGKTWAGQLEVYMDELLSKTLKKIEEKFQLEPVAIPEDLRETRFPLSLLKLQCYNWKAEKIRKIYFMRVKVRVPTLDVLGMAIYPETDFDVPIFTCDLSCTKKKVFTHINFIPLFSDESYHKKYIEPLKPVFEKYNHFPPHKMREWMLKYHSSYTFYSMPEKSSLEELKCCALDYLSVYLDIISQAKPIEDKQYLEKVKEAHKAYENDLLTKDASQKMLARIIGKEKARRIFQEVIA
jgi:15,16-dihydrobiliverdin:ferredoxin oxidoreductase